MNPLYIVKKEKKVKLYYRPKKLVKLKLPFCTFTAF